MLNMDLADREQTKRQEYIAQRGATSGKSSDLGVRDSSWFPDCAPLSGTRFLGL